VGLDTKQAFGTEKPEVKGLGEVVVMVAAITVVVAVVVVVVVVVVVGEATDDHPCKLREPPEWNGNMCDLTARLRLQRIGLEKKARCMHA
jgi:heme/copper-type cytochrome/quinol oxidase subunit 2